MRTAWDALAPGGTAVVIGLAPAGVLVSLPANEFLSEKQIRGSYYGSGDPAQAVHGLVDLVRAGRLDLGDVVSDLVSLDEVQGALERLRHGQGDRSVAILDPGLAGVSPGSGV
jgi:S-(hydroxymethyl)glutathione dehydrogenase/alcohol dehydrogenase